MRQQNEIQLRQQYAIQLMNAGYNLGRINQAFTVVNFKPLTEVEFNNLDNTEYNKK